MSRPLRFIPEGGSLVEITCRTDQGRYLLRPDPVIDDILLGVLGRAQRLYPVEICGFSFLSSHYHLLLWVPDARSMSRFMWYFQTNAAREVARRTDWPDGIWSDRYTSIPVSDEPAAQVDRLRYVLAQGVKDGLVARVEEWPGISMLKAVLEGKPIRGTWFNRTQEYRARLRRKKKDSEPECFPSEEIVTLSQLPCWRHLSPEVYRDLVAGLVREIESDAAAERKLTGQRAARPGGHPEPASANASGEAQEVAGTSVPRGQQGCPASAEGSLRPLPWSFSGGSGKAEGWRPPREIPQRLLPASPAVRGFVCDRITVAGDGAAEPHIKYFRSWKTSRSGEVRPKSREQLRTG